MKSWTGTLQVLAAGTCFGFLGIFAKLAFLMGLSVGELLCFRFFIAALVLGLFLFVFHRDWLLIGRKQVFISLLLGVFGYAVFSTLYFESIRGITVGLAALLLYSFPLFVNLGAWLFLKEPLRGKQLFSVVMASIGLVLLVWGDWQIQRMSAVLFGLGSGLAYAGYVLVSGQVQKNVRPLSSSFYVIVGAFVTLTLFHRPEFAQLMTFSYRKLGLIVGLALVGTIAPLTLFLAGLQKMPSSQASILVMIEPVVATVAGAMLFEESMTPLQGLGGFLIILSMLFQTHDPGTSESLA